MNFEINMEFLQPENLKQKWLDNIAELNKGLHVDWRYKIEPKHKSKDKSKSNIKKLQAKKKHIRKHR